MKITILKQADIKKYYLHIQCTKYWYHKYES